MGKSGETRGARSFSWHLSAQSLIGDWQNRQNNSLLFFLFVRLSFWGCECVCVGGAGCVIKEEYHVSLSPRGGRLFLARKWDFTHNSHSVAWLKAIGKHPGVRVAF